MKRPSLLLLLCLAFLWQDALGYDAKVESARKLFGLWGSASGIVAVGYASGAVGWILTTTDAGKTWNTQKSGATQPLRGLWGTSPRELFAVGDRGTILHSTDA